jgi:UDP-N-acetylglucosamine diphosphorylase/glucosamine-1-phosphate N-acetyltransferase
MKQAVILAAGEGQRLRPFTVTRPKVMLSIADKPILEHVVESLARNGIRQIVMVVGYRREQVFSHFGNGERFGVDITYVTQEKQLGTAHALNEARRAAEKEFLVVNGDNLIDAETIAGFVEVCPPAVLVKEVPNPARYGVLTLENGAVKAIVEKPSNAAGNAANTGIYAFTREIFDFIDTELDIPDVLSKMLSGRRSLAAVETTGTWMDVVYPWDIIVLNGAILKRTAAAFGGTIESGAYVKGAVSIGKDTLIRSNSYVLGPAIIGENCEIGPNAVIMPATSIGDNVAIAPFTIVENSVIGDDVSIGPSSMVQDCVIDKGCVIKGHLSAVNGEADVKVEDSYHTVKVGAMLGTGCNLGAGVVAQPGVIVGNYCEVRAMKTISGRLPDRSRVY